MKLYRKIEAENTWRFEIGDVIAFTLDDGEPVEAMAVKKEDDGMIFYLVDTLRKEYPMNTGMTNEGGYEKCELRKKLNGEILDRFPDEISDRMIAFANGDLLRLATEREIFGRNVFGECEDKSVQQWEPMKNARNRIACFGKECEMVEWYWLQNAVPSTVTAFLCFGTGDATKYLASYAAGVRPVFKI